MKVIYIAGPFRGPSTWDIQTNIMNAMGLALEVWKLGAVALCPHANTMFFQGAAPDNTWLHGDLELLSRCDAVLVTPDWARSVGARGEVALALERGMPVLASLDELARYLTGGRRYGDFTTDSGGAASSGGAAGLGTAQEP